MTEQKINNEYEKLLQHILDNGVHKDDRTGTGTTSIFGYQMRFNLQEGFPLITTKKIHTKSMIHELIWFLNGDTNVKYLEDNGVKIWDAWRKPYTLVREVVYIDKKEMPYVPYSGDFSRKGVNASKGSEDDKLANSWVRMMKRCYDPTHEKYSMYGAVGVSVASEWHDPQTFINDVKTIPHWYYKQNNWNEFELDKDYYGSSQYGPTTCVWLRTDENNFYTKSASVTKVTNAEGEVREYLTQSIAAKTIGMSTSSMNRFIKHGIPTTLKANNKIFIGWEFEISEGIENKLARLELIQEGELGEIYGKQWRAWPDPYNPGETIDQISDVIEQIKTNPDSRRLIVNAWNPAALPFQALPACHTLFQFYVVDGRLSCQLYQRSGDALLGIPFNIGSYSLLVHMIAAETGLEVGEFIHTIGDAHIYDNHLEQVKLQLSRDVRPFPTLKLKKAKNIFSYKIEDFEFEGYDPHPAIKAPVAV